MVLKRSNVVNVSESKDSKQFILDKMEQIVQLGKETMIQGVGQPVLLNLNKGGFVASRARNWDMEDVTTAHANTEDHRNH